jgi:hypothetical protein
MKNFVITSFFIFALILSATGAVPHARAQQESCSNIGQTCYTAFGDQGTCVSSPEGDTGYCEIGAAAPEPYTVDPAAAKTPTQLPAPPPDYKDFNSIMSYIVQIFAWLLGIAIVALNYAVYYTVITMGDYVRNLNAVGVTWTILRDLGNILLIFGFLAVGITTILGTDAYGFKKLLPKLLMAAVLLNFSLFITEAVIDAGNLFATQFYKQINGGQMPTPDTLTNRGLADKVMAQLGFATLYDGVREQKNNEAIALVKSNPLLIGFLSILLFIITAFVFFTLALILVARFVILILLIILAPLGFAGWAWPQLAGVTKKYWDKLFEQTITAPVLFLMLYVSLAIIMDKGFLRASGQLNWLGLLDGKGTNIAGFGGTVISFLVAMGLLLFVVVMAKNLSATGAGWATGMAGKLSFGAVGLAGRYSVGLGSNWAAKRLRSTKLARIPLVGTGAVKGLEKLAGSNFDARGVKMFKTAGINVGDAHKGGYKDDLKKKIESRTKYAADLKGKDFKDLSPEEQIAIANQENDISRLKKEKTDKQKAGTLTPGDIKYYNDAIGRSETELDEIHKTAGTEKGNKLKYAATLSNRFLGILASNSQAAKKIKEEAKKSKDDKELETFRKALQKMGGDDGGTPPTAPAAAASGTPSGTAPKA